MFLLYMVDTDFIDDKDNKKSFSGYMFIVFSNALF